MDCDVEEPMGIFLMPPGGFFVFGCMIALVNKIMKNKKITPKQEMGCTGCPSSTSCNILSVQADLDKNKLEGGE